MKLIFNADDFGQSPGINKAVVHLASSRKINAASVMVNMPFWRDIDTLKQFPDFDIGLHFNITEGRPISNPGTVYSLIGSDGYFYDTPSFVNRGRKGLILGEHVIHEFNAQLYLLRSMAGDRLRHVDTHQGVHFYPWVYQPLSKIKSTRQQLVIRSHRHAFLKEGNPAGIMKTGLRLAAKVGVKKMVKELWYERISQRLEKAFCTTDGTLVVKEYYDPVATIEWLLRHGIPYQVNGLFELSCHPAADLSGLEHVSAGRAGKRMTNVRLAEFEALDRLSYEVSTLSSF